MDEAEYGNRNSKNEKYWVQRRGGNLALHYINRTFERAMIFSIKIVSALNYIIIERN